MATIQDAQCGAAFDISELGTGVTRHSSTRLNVAANAPMGSGPVNGVLVNDASLQRLSNGQYSTKGGSGSFSVTLEVSPPAGVTQVVTAAVTQGGCQVNGGQSATLSFTSSTWNTPQTVTVTSTYQGASKVLVTSPECLPATLDFLN